MPDPSSRHAQLQCLCYPCHTRRADIAVTHPVPRPGLPRMNAVSVPRMIDNPPQNLITVPQCGFIAYMGQHLTGQIGWWWMLYGRTTPPPLPRLFLFAHPTPVGIDCYMPQTDACPGRPLDVTCPRLALDWWFPLAVPITHIPYPTPQLPSPHICSTQFPLLTCPLRTLIYLSLVGTQLDCLTQ